MFFFDWHNLVSCSIVPPQSKLETLQPTVTSAGKRLYSVLSHLFFMVLLLYGYEIHLGKVKSAKQ